MLSQKRDEKRPLYRWLAAAIAFVGFVLSPLSWWNDVVINVPLAYAFSWPFARLDERLFLPAFVLGYWLTNLLGFLLLHWGARGAAGKTAVARHNLRQDIAITLLYTLLIALLVWLGWLPNPTTFLP